MGEHFIERKCGGWLGLYDGDGLRIGVTGETEGDTRILLEGSVDRWRTMLGLPDVENTDGAGI